MTPLEILGGVLALWRCCCDPQRIGNSRKACPPKPTCARASGPKRLGRAGGERVFEYNRQPSGHQNYMISIGPDGG